MKTPFFAPLKSILVMGTLLLLTGCPRKEDPAPAPVALFDYSPSTNLVAPVTLAFKNLSTNATSYLWKTESGQSSTSKEVTLSIPKGGTYTMSLTATGEGGSDTYSETIYVDDPVVIPTTAPVADFTFSPSQNLIAPARITFTNTSKNASSYRWDFGDGTTSTSMNPVKDFSKAGDYSVKLTATDSKNQTAQKTATISVKAAAVSVQPLADWTWSANNLKVTFTNQSKNANSYSWNFGDGKTSTVANPVYEYAKAGVYTVTLTASDGKTQHKDSKLVTISAAPGSACDWAAWQKLVTVTRWEHNYNFCSKTEGQTLLSIRNDANVEMELMFCIQKADGKWESRFSSAKPGGMILNNWWVCGKAKQLKYWVRPASRGTGTGSNRCDFPSNCN